MYNVSCLFINDEIFRTLQNDYALYYIFACSKQWLAHENKHNGMQENIKPDLGVLISRIEKINNRTENKLEVLKTTLVEYDRFRNLHSDIFSNNYQVSDLINSITIAQTKRKNVSKKSLHKEFLKTKDDALFRLWHTHI